MHTLLLLITPLQNPEREDIRRLMEPFRRTEDGRGEWDYYLPGGQFNGRLSGQQLEPVSDLYNNVVPVGAVQTHGGAILTPDGYWHDARDSGFRMTASEAERAAAWAKWERYAANLLEDYSDHMAVGLDVHS